MPHDHSHHHHAHAAQRYTKAFARGLLLNAAFVVVEFVVGLQTNSLGLISDAGHNLGDVAGLLLSWLSVYLASRHRGTAETMHYQKLSAWLTFLNNLVLFVAVGIIAWEAVQRFNHPEPVGGIRIAIVAAVGILVNAITAYLFYRDRKDDINIRSAYVHMLADALVSAGVVVAGILIYTTGWQWLDPAISLLIVIVIVYSSYGVFMESWRMVQGKPRS